MNYVQTYSETFGDCMVQSIQQCATAKRDRIVELLEGPDELWQVRMMFVLALLGYEVKLHEFELPNGKTPMHGFEMQVQFPKGKFIMYMNGHVCAMVEGVIFDKTDSRFNKVFWAWELIKIKTNGRNKRNSTGGTSL